jgi:hypothetical protein
LKNVERNVLGNVVLASGLALEAVPAAAAPGYTILRQLTNITTGTIESVKLRSQEAKDLAFVSTGDVMGPGTATAERQIYLWREQPDGTGTITRVTNLPGCESYEVSRPTDTTQSDRPMLISFVSTCNFDPMRDNSDGNPEIFFYDIEAGTFHQITNTVAPVVNGDPFPSDSGRCLVFRSNGNLNNNIPSHPHYDPAHPGPGYSNPDFSDEVFVYGKLDADVDYPYNNVFTQLSNGPAGTTSEKPVMNGYYWPRQCASTAFQSDHDQMGGGHVGTRIYLYKMPMSSLEEITADEIPYGFEPGNYRNPMISAASPFARGPHIVFESEPDLWRNESQGTNIFDWRDFHPRMTQFTNVGAGFVAKEPTVGDGGGVIAFHSDGELLNPERPARTGELPPFNADANFEIFRLEGRKNVWQITQTSGCQNTGVSIKDDGDRMAFVSSCDLIAGKNAGGAQQVFLWALQRSDYPLVADGACLQADACCIHSIKGTTCYHPLKGKKPKILRPNCIDKPNGCGD